MRRYLLACGIAVLVPTLTVALEPVARADFDPSGRGRPGQQRPPQTRPPQTRPPQTGTPAKPRPPATTAGPATKGPSTDALIERYTKSALDQPSAPFPLQRLAQLYRERDGDLKKLIADFEQRAAAPGDSWPAKVVLAGVYKQDGRYDEAIKAYEAAIAERPTDPSALMALAQLYADRGDKAKARARYEQALPFVKPGVDTEQLRRTLLGLCLDLKDYPAAKAQHDALVRTGQGSLFVKGELGRELMVRGEYERAQVEFEALVRAASGDNRALAPALRDLGESLAKQKKAALALPILKRALAVAGGSAGIRAQILLIMADAYRAEGKLTELIAILEAEPGSDFQRMTTLGALYEETGQVDRALAIYEKALKVNGRALDTRVRLVHLLQSAGRLDEAIAQYEALIKAAPHNPDFVFELCETLIQRGERPKALKLLLALEARASSDAVVLARVADFYEGIEERERSLKVLQRLAQVGGGDATHLVDLGDRYYQAGDKKKALETWARIKGAIPSRAAAEATLGQVYLDHDMPAEALTALREALKLDPANVKYKKALAVAIERTASSQSVPAASYGEALAIWQELLTQAQRDKLLAREARQHIVALWSLRRELPAQLGPLAQRLAATPPDLEAGRLLAEVERKLGRLAEAEATLRKVIGVAPGDDEAMLALERLLVQRQDLDGAIAVLERLVSADPKRAREYYQRMARYAAEQYQDDDAIRYAARAVELSPEDAGGHEKLGDMYRKRQDIPQAIAEYRLAIAKNDRLFTVYFNLADLLLSRGETEQADLLLRRVVRASPDEELIARAARMSMQIGLGRGALEPLERELLPLAVGNPQKPIYRRLLVETYGAMTFPLVQQARHGLASQRSAARAELRAIGTRAVKPLLDALMDDKADQQTVAVTVLGFVENKGAGPALYNYAMGKAEPGLRRRAMVALGALRDPTLLPKYTQVLLPNDLALAPGDGILAAAAWGVARMGQDSAQPLLVRMLATSSPEVRGFAALGLGLSHQSKHAPALLALARSPEAGPLVRSAALRGLAELGAPQPATIALMVEFVEASDVGLRAAALDALGRLGKGDDAARARAVDTLARGAFSPTESTRDAAFHAAIGLVLPGGARDDEPLALPDGDVSLREAIGRSSTDEPAASARVAALKLLGPALEREAVAAVVASPERASLVARALVIGEAGPGLLPFVSDVSALAPDDRETATAVIARVAARVVPGLIALVGHPDPDVRTRAAQFLASRPEPGAQAAVVEALDDPSEAVTRGVLASLGRVPNDATIQAVARVAAGATSWSLRVDAVQALGRLGAGASNAVVTNILADRASRDSFALVREAALRALHSVDPAKARTALAQAARADAEPRVRRVAAELLASARGPAP